MKGGGEVWIGKGRREKFGKEKEGGENLERKRKEGKIWKGKRRRGKSRKKKEGRMNKKFYKIGQIKLVLCHAEASLALL